MSAARICRTFHYGVMSFGDPSTISVRSNTIEKWNRGGLGAAGIEIEHARAGEVRSNAFG